MSLYKRRVVTGAVLLGLLGTGFLTLKFTRNRVPSEPGPSAVNAASFDGEFPDITTGDTPVEELRYSETGPPPRRDDPPIEPGEWDRADLATLRLPPDAFPQLPAAVADELRRLGCAIPQSFPEPHNVISGRFLSSAQVDWAVLCSRNRVSSLLLFPGGETDAIIDFGPSEDIGWLQGVGRGTVAYSRAISVADPPYIKEHYQAYGGPRPPPLEHDGIEESFVGKASGILYWYDGEWLHLQGAD